MKAGRFREVRTKDLRELVNEIKRGQGVEGGYTVRLGWVKAHVGIEGNERADQMAKQGAN